MSCTIKHREIEVVVVIALWHGPFILCVSVCHAVCLVINFVLIYHVVHVYLEVSDAKLLFSGFS